VAIDRATRWVYIAIKPNKSAASARAFLKALAKACPIKITKLLTENEPQAKFQRSYNGKEFTDRLFGARGREPSGEHEFDQLCQALGIEHRLTKRRAPQTNGMVERFNGRISDILKTHHFHSGEDLRATLHRYVALYNHQLPQAALGGKTPLQAMKEWFKSNPELFHRRPYDRPGCDTASIPEPGTLGLLTLGALAAARVRRRRTWSRMKRFTTFFGLLALSLCAAADGRPTPVDLRPIEDRFVELEVGAERLHIQSPAQWQAFWRRFSSTAPADIDFRRHDVLVVLMGTQGSGGYSIHIQAVDAVAGGTRVKLLSCRPPWGSTQLAVVTSPYDAQRVPKLATPIEWRTVKGRTGRPPC